MRAIKLLRKKMSSEKPLDKNSATTNSPIESTEKKFATSQLARSAITGMAAAKIGAALAVQKTTSLISKNKLTDEQQLNNEKKIGKLLFSALGQLRGTALKVSQLLSTEMDLLPEGIRQELAKSCYQVIPLNRAVISKVFSSEFKASPSDMFSSFDPRAFAAASLGQVHRAETKSGAQVAVKIQYPGIAASIKSDMKMLRTLLSTLANSSDILPNQAIVGTTLDEVEQRLQEEVDYCLEAQHTRWFEKNLQCEGIVIPSVYADYSTAKVLTTSLLTGLHLEQWLATNPSQEQCNCYGQKIYDCFLYSAFVLGRLHADPHPGNYLFMHNQQLGILDFGCVKIFDSQFAVEKTALLNAFLKTDQQRRSVSILAAYQQQGIIEKTLSLSEFETVLQPLLDPMYQWICAPFQQSNYDFSHYPSCPKMSLENAKIANQFLRAIPQDHIYFDRSMFGIFSMLKRIGAVVKTENQWIAVG